MDERLQYLLDRLEIDDLLTRYATMVDARDWDGLDSVFTPDARLDYRSAGGVRGSYPEVRRWLSEVLPIFERTQHLVVNRAVEVDASRESARSVSTFHNPNRLTVDGQPWLFVVGGRYHDGLVRSASGWRIATRVEETLWWDHPMPGLPPVPYPLEDDALA
jgi:3-phenylpropionate/cinnamic acid dioxygenase small subunit